MQTMLDVADNTGAKRAQCIKVLGGTHRRYATLGDVVVASVKKSLPGSDVKPGTIVKGVIVRVRKNTRRQDGTYVRFDRTEAHMHHKFALADDQHLLTGSYNWTRSAAAVNDENIIVTDHPKLIDNFSSKFSSMWNNLGR